MKKDNVVFRITLRAIQLGLMLLSLGISQKAQAQECLPRPASVPGLSGAPVWVGVGGASDWRAELQDPRWNGSPLRTYKTTPLSAAEVDDGLFRVLVSGSTLYLSFQTTQDVLTGFDPFDSVYFGFSHATSTNLAWGLQIYPKKSGTPVAAPAGYNPLTDPPLPFVISPVDINWFASTDATTGKTWVQNISAQPSWLQDVSSWISAPGAVWAVTFKINLADPTLGSPAGGNMRFFYGTRIGNSAGMLEFATPTPAGSAANSVGHVTSDDLLIPRDPALWNDTLAPGSACSQECLPTPASVPGLSGAPVWVGVGGASDWRAELQDPRWNGSPLRTYKTTPLSAAEVDDGLFRVLVSGSTLYLSFQTTQDVLTGFDPFDSVYFGFSHATSTNLAWGLQIYPKKSGTPVAAPAGYNPLTDPPLPFVISPVDMNWFMSTDATTGKTWAQNIGAQPSWLQDASSWISAPGAVWAVTFKINLADPTLGSPAGGNMRFFYGTRIGNSAGMLEFATPTPAGSAANSVGHVTSDDLLIPRDPALWNDTLAPGSACGGASTASGGAPESGGGASTASGGAPESGGGASTASGGAPESGGGGAAASAGGLSGLSGGAVNLSTGGVPSGGQPANGGESPSAAEQGHSSSGCGCRLSPSEDFVGLPGVALGLVLGFFRRRPVVGRDRKRA